MIVLAAVVGLVVGAALGAGVTFRWCTVRADLHNYRRVRLEAVAVDQLHKIADSNYRLARRLGRALDTAETIYRDQVGDLLDTVARQRRQLAPRHTPRRYPLDYGSHR